MNLLIAAPARSGGGLSLCSTPHFAHYSSRTIATAGYWDIGRIRLRNQLPEPLLGLVFAFANHTVAGGLYEGATANNIVVAAAVQAYGANANDESTARIPVTFGGGSLSVTIPPKCVAFSDIVPFQLAANAEYWLRCGVSTPVTNGVYPASGCYLGGSALYATNNGEGWGLANADNTKLYTGGSTVGAGPLLLGYGPEAVYGLTASGKIYQGVMIVGDSIALGYADPGDNDGSFAAMNRGGPFQRALTAIGKPYALGTYSGETGFSTTAGFLNAYARLCRDRLALPLNRVLAAYGRNDINTRYGLSETSAQILAFMQAGVASLVSAVCGRGLHLAVTTVLPTPGSTTGHTTAAGAQPISSSRADEAARQAYNAWLRDTGPSGAAVTARAAIAAAKSRAKFRVIDICAPIETNQAGALTLNGGCFKVPASVTIYDSGTATGGTTVKLTDSGKSWTANAYRGRVVWIYGGTGQYSNAVIQYNDATNLYCIAPFSGAATPDATSQYRIVDTPTADATHPAPWGNATIAAGIEADLRSFMGLA